MGNKPSDYEIIESAKMFADDFIYSIDMVGRFATFINSSIEDAHIIRDALLLCDKKIHELNGSDVNDVKRLMHTKKLYSLYENKLKHKRKSKSFSDSDNNMKRRFKVVRSD